MANNQTEYQIALKLLGRKPRAPFRIQTKCKDGTPQVLMADPVFIEDNILKPFPTFLWLLCPRLYKEIARLEEKGLVKEYSQRLSVDKDFELEFNKGQRQVAQYRLKLAKEIHPNELPQHIIEILSDTSIAGSKNLRGVKCLHSHVAQQLVFENNPIGAEILEITGDCSNVPECYQYGLERQEK